MVKIKKDNFNIMYNIKVIEELKANILVQIADLFKLLSKGTTIAQSAILECISGAIILLYLLGERLGYSFISIDENIKSKLKAGIEAGDEIEKESRDLSKLYTHIRERE